MSRLSKLWYSVTVGLPGVAMLLSFVSLISVATGATFGWVCVGVTAAVSAVVRVMRAKAAKILVGVMMGLVLAVCVAAFWVGNLFLGVRHIETIKTTPSPDGRYTACVMALSDGALGGDTEVWVHETATQWRLLVCLVEKDPKAVYFAETYRSHEQIDIAWTDADTLCVTDGMYSIEKTYTIAF